MIALLVVLTFVTAVLIDHLVNRNPIRVEDPRAMKVVAPRLAPAVVAGFNVPDNLLYHIGHTWALAESPQLVRIGLDDLAAKVAGPVDKINVPERGQWIRQGQKIIAMHRDGHDLELLSPIEGAVVNINEKVLRNPELAHTDPYGEGWLLTVNSPEANTNFRNLLRGTMARRWMDDSAQKLRGPAPWPRTAAWPSTPSSTRKTSPGSKRRSSSPSTFASRRGRSGGLSGPPLCFGYWVTGGVQMFGLANGQGHALPEH